MTIPMPSFRRTRALSRKILDDFHLAVTTIHSDAFNLRVSSFGAVGRGTDSSPRTG